MGRVVRGGRPSPFSDGGREESPDTTRQQALRKWGTWEAKAPADGHALVLGSLTTLVINSYVYKSLTFNTSKDFAPITLVAEIPNVLLVPSSSPIKSLKELIEYATSEALASSDNNQSQAARLLGISRQALNKRLRKRG